VVVKESQDMVAFLLGYIAVFGDDGKEAQNRFKYGFTHGSGVSGKVSPKIEKGLVNANPFSERSE
jgi:hypothetical protein